MLRRTTLPDDAWAIICSYLPFPWAFSTGMCISTTFRHLLQRMPHAHPSTLEVRHTDQLAAMAERHAHVLKKKHVFLQLSCTAPKCKHIQQLQPTKLTIHTYISNTQRVSFGQHLKELCVPNQPIATINLSECIKVNVRTLERLTISDALTHMPLSALSQCDNFCQLTIANGLRSQDLILLAKYCSKQITHLNVHMMIDTQMDPVLPQTICRFTQLKRLGLDFGPQRHNSANVELQNEYAKIGKACLALKELQVCYPTYNTLAMFQHLSLTSLYILGNIAQNTEQTEAHVYHQIFATQAAFLHHLRLDNTQLCGHTIFSKYMWPHLHTISLDGEFSSGTTFPCPPHTFPVLKNVCVCGVIPPRFFHQMHTGLYRLHVSGIHMLTPEADTDNLLGNLHQLTQLRTLTLRPAFFRRVSHLALTSQDIQQALSPLRHLQYVSLGFDTLDTQIVHALTDMPHLYQLKLPYARAIHKRTLCTCTTTRRTLHIHTPTGIAYIYRDQPFKWTDGDVTDMKDNTARRQFSFLA